MSHHSEHHHDHGASGQMPFREKFARILDHWVHHNDEHAETFRQWARKAEEEGLQEASSLLLEAAGLNAAVNDKLRQAAGLLAKRIHEE